MTRTNSFIGSVILLLIVFFGFNRTGLAQEFSLQGNYAKTVYFTDGKVVNLPIVFFTVNIKDCKWDIRCVQDKGPNSPDYTEATYDGTNIYFIVNISNTVQSQIKKGVSMGLNIANATVYRAEVCNMEEAYDISPIWLAYASGCYFNAQTNDFVEPAFNKDPASAMRFGPPKNYRIQARWSLTDSTVRFLSHLEYLSEGRWMNVKGEYLNRPTPYSNGFTNSYYRVDLFTNVGSLIAPLSSKLKTYTTKNFATNSSDLRLMSEYQFNTTWITNHIENTTFQPIIPGVTVVEDSRMTSKSEKQLVYYYTTNRWPSTAELENIKAQQVNKVFVPSSAKIFRFILLTLLLVPPITFLVIRIKNKNRAK